MNLKSSGFDQKCVTPGVAKIESFDPAPTHNCDIGLGPIWSTASKLVVWGPVVWDSNRGARKYQSLS